MKWYKGEVMNTKIAPTEKSSWLVEGDTPICHHDGMVFRFCQGDIVVDGFSMGFVQIEPSSHCAGGVRKVKRSDANRFLEGFPHIFLTKLSNRLQYSCNEEFRKMLLL